MALQSEEWWTAMCHHGDLIQSRCCAIERDENRSLSSQSIRGKAIGNLGGFCFVMPRFESSLRRASKLCTSINCGASRLHYTINDGTATESKAFQTFTSDLTNLPNSRGAMTRACSCLTFSYFGENSQLICTHFHFRDGMLESWEGN